MRERLMCASGGASKGLPLRLPGFALFGFLTAGMAYAGELPRLNNLTSQPVTTEAQFQFGGAAARVTLPMASLSEPIDEQPRMRLSVPRLIRETQETVQDTPVGGLRFYFGEAWTNGDDVFQVGTALTRGQTTAGIAVTYQDDFRDLTSSELYLDYAVTSQFSVGISGLISGTVTDGAAPLPQLGVNAQLDTGNGTYLRGGVSDAGDTPPIFGVAIGLRF